MLRGLYRKINIWGPDFKHHATSVRNNKRILQKLTRRKLKHKEDGF